MRRSNRAFSAASRFSRAAGSSGRRRGGSIPGQVNFIRLVLMKETLRPSLFETQRVRFDFRLRQREVLLAALRPCAVADLHALQPILVREGDGFLGGVANLIRDGADSRLIPMRARAQRQRASRPAAAKSSRLVMLSIVLRRGPSVWGVVGTGGFEPPTCRLGGDRSIHLSYVPTSFLL